MAVTVHHRLDGLPPDLQRYSAHAAGRAFFASLDWYRCLAESGLRGEASPRVYAWQDGAAPPVLLFGLDRRPGSHLSSLTSIYSPRFGLTASGPVPERAIRALSARLAGEGEPAWSVIDLRYLRADHDDTRALVAALGAAGYAVDVYFQYGNWYAQPAGLGYAQYLAQRPGYLRNLLRRKSRALARAHAVRFELIESPGPALEAAVEAYARVYAASWKRAELCPDLVPRLIRSCASLGILRLGLMYIDDQPAAAQLWVVDHGLADIYKLVHARQFDRYSVGSLLTARMFEHVLDVDRVGEIDYGLGDEPYKADWLDRRRQIVGLEAINPRTRRGRLLLARRALRDGLRRAGLRSWDPVDL